MFPREEPYDRANSSQARALNSDLYLFESETFQPNIVSKDSFISYMNGHQQFATRKSESKTRPKEGKMGPKFGRKMSNKHVTNSIYLQPLASEHVQKSDPLNFQGGGLLSTTSQQNVPSVVSKAQFQSAHMGRGPPPVQPKANEAKSYGKRARIQSSKIYKNTKLITHSQYRSPYMKDPKKLPKSNFQTRNTSSKQVEAHDYEESEEGDREQVKFYPEISDSKIIKINPNQIQKPTESQEFILGQSAEADISHVQDAQSIDYMLREGPTLIGPELKAAKGHQSTTRLEQVDEESQGAKEERIVRIRSQKNQNSRPTLKKDKQPPPAPIYSLKALRTFSGETGFFSGQNTREQPTSPDRSHNQNPIHAKGILQNSSPVSQRFPQNVSPMRQQLPTEGKQSNNCSLIFPAGEKAVRKVRKPLQQAKRRDQSVKSNEPQVVESEQPILFYSRPANGDYGEQVEHQDASFPASPGQQSKGTMRIVEAESVPRIVKKVEKRRFIGKQKRVSRERAISPNNCSSQEGRQSRNTKKSTQIWAPYQIEGGSLKHFSKEAGLSKSNAKAMKQARAKKEKFGAKLDGIFSSMKASVLSKNKKRGPSKLSALIGEAYDTQLKAISVELEVARSQAQQTDREAVRVKQAASRTVAALKSLAANECSILKSRDCLLFSSELRRVYAQWLFSIVADIHKNIEFSLLRIQEQQREFTMMRTWRTHVGQLRVVDSLVQFSDCFPLVQFSKMKRGKCLKQEIKNYLRRHFETSKQMKRAQFQDRFEFDLIAIVRHKPYCKSSGTRQYSIVDSPANQSEIWDFKSPANRDFPSLARLFNGLAAISETSQELSKTVYFQKMVVCLVAAGEETKVQIGKKAFRKPALQKQALDVLKAQKLDQAVQSKLLKMFSEPRFYLRDMNVYHSPGGDDLSVTEGVMCRQELQALFGNQFAPTQVKHLVRTRTFDKYFSLIDVFYPEKRSKAKHDAQPSQVKSRGAPKMHSFAPHEMLGSLYVIEEEQGLFDAKGNIQFKVRRLTDLEVCMLVFFTLKVVDLPSQDLQEGESSFQQKILEVKINWNEIFWASMADRPKDRQIGWASEREKEIRQQEERFHPDSESAAPPKYLLIGSTIEDGSLYKEYLVQIKPRKVPLEESPCPSTTVTSFCFWPQCLCRVQGTYQLSFQDSRFTIEAARQMPPPQRLLKGDKAEPKSLGERTRKLKKGGKSLNRPESSYANKQGGKSTAAKKNEPPLQILVKRVIQSKLPFLSELDLRDTAKLAKLIQKYQLALFKQSALAQDQLKSVLLSAQQRREQRLASQPKYQTRFPMRHAESSESSLQPVTNNIFLCPNHLEEMNFMNSCFGTTLDPALGHAMTQERLRQAISFKQQSSSVFWKILQSQNYSLWRAGTRGSLAFDLFNFAEDQRSFDLLFPKHSVNLVIKEGQNPSNLKQLFLRLALQVTSQSCKLSQPQITPLVDCLDKSQPSSIGVLELYLEWVQAFVSKADKKLLLIKNQNYNYIIKAFIDKAWAFIESLEQAQRNESQIWEIVEKKMVMVGDPLEAGGEVTLEMVHRAKATLHSLFPKIFDVITSTVCLKTAPTESTAAQYQDVYSKFTKFQMILDYFSQIDQYQVCLNQELAQQPRRAEVARQPSKSVKAFQGGNLRQLQQIYKSKVNPQHQPPPPDESSLPSLPPPDFNKNLDLYQADMKVVSFNQGRSVGRSSQKVNQQMGLPSMDAMHSQKGTLSSNSQNQQVSKSFAKGDHFLVGTNKAESQFKQSAPKFKPVQSGVKTKGVVSSEFGRDIEEANKFISKQNIQNINLAIQRPQTVNSIITQSQSKFSQPAESVKDQRANQSSTAQVALLDDPKPQQYPPARPLPVKKPRAKTGKKAMPIKQSTQSNEFAAQTQIRFGNYNQQPFENKQQRFTPKQKMGKTFVNCGESPTRVGVSQPGPLYSVPQTLDPEKGMLPTTFAKTRQFPNDDPQALSMRNLDPLLINTEKRTQDLPQSSSVQSSSSQFHRQISFPADQHQVKVLAQAGVIQSRQRFSSNREQQSLKGTASKKRREWRDPSI